VSSPASQRILPAFVALGGLLLVVLGWESFLLVPLRLLLVLLHEAGHAMGAWLTGGSVLRVALDPRGGAATLTLGGHAPTILLAGYAGSVMAGAGVIMGAARAPRPTAVALAMIVLLGVAWMPGAFGSTWCAILAFLLIGVGWAAPHATLRRVLQAIGALACVHAVLDAQADGGRGDALLLASQTGVPATVWTWGWTALGVLVLGVALAWSGRTR
jgi:hypothetical protein